LSTQQIVQDSAYQFGDTTVAKERLELLATVFRPSTVSFLRRVITSPPRAAVDLGAGLGFSTELLRQTTKAVRTVGLDSSPQFVAVARSRFGTSEFIQHDVTQLPLPVATPDVIYCRFLLTHIRGPKEVVAGWIGEVEPGGLILLEELEFIEARSEMFAAYERFVEGLLASQGQTLFVGPTVGACCPSGAELVHTTVTHVPVARKNAASLALMNLSQLCKTEWATRAYGVDGLDQLRRGLESFRHSDGDSPIFGLRQHVLQRQ
jgi:ubiquinone/menaquinone biosynthesis C-methylase UbiE